MRRTKLVVTMCVAASWAMAANAKQTLSTGITTYGHNLRVALVTVAEPPLTPQENVDFTYGYPIDGELLHRVILNKAAHSWFGYDLTVQPIEGSEQCRVSIEPLTIDAAQIASWNSYVDATWAAGPQPRYPAPQVVGPADTIVLDVMVSADGRRRVTDYMQVACHKSEVAVAPKDETPRDFTLDDVELNESSASLYVNGNPVSGIPRVGHAHGHLLWFYFPGKGRFIVSLTPEAGYDFHRAGTMRGGRIYFDDQGDQYEVRGGHPTVSAAHVWNVWVYRDEAFRPKDGNAEFGGAETAEALLASGDLTTSPANADVERR